jgi:hypothetical protein
MPRQITIGSFSVNNLLKNLKKYFLDVFLCAKHEKKKEILIIKPSISVLMNDSLKNGKIPGFIPEMAFPMGFSQFFLQKWNPGHFLSTPTFLNFPRSITLRNSGEFLSDIGNSPRN